MKKNKLLEFIKAKGFYVVLLIGFVAISLMAGVYVISTTDKTKNLVDLNEPTDEFAYERDEPTTQANPNISNTEELHTTEDDSSSNLQDEYVEEQPEVYNRYDEYVEIFEEDVTEPQVNTSETQELTTPSDTAQAEEPEELAQEVVGTSVQNNLDFNEAEGLSWPIQGNVIINYNMDSTVYFQTLEQYKCNPAIIISANIGDQVKSAAEGIVDSIETIPETGVTVTVSIGNNYKLIYGQLAEVQLKSGDLIEKGAILGKIAEPTGYYELEGSNLYFQVMKKGKSVNPMTLLQ